MQNRMLGSPKKHNNDEMLNEEQPQRRLPQLAVVDPRAPLKL